MPVSISREMHATARLYNDDEEGGNGHDRLDLHQCLPHPRERRGDPHLHAAHRCVARIPQGFELYGSVLKPLTLKPRDRRGGPDLHALHRCVAHVAQPFLSYRFST